MHFSTRGVQKLKNTIKTCWKKSLLKTFYKEFEGDFFPLPVISLLQFFIAFLVFGRFSA
jgi:hypothetical protein